MKDQRGKLEVIILGGVCFAVMVLLLCIAYVPEFAPMAYQMLRQSRLIMVIPMITATGLISSLGWLWWELK